MTADRDESAAARYHNRDLGAGPVAVIWRDIPPQRRVSLFL
jgi:hypothetical protein